MLANLRLSPAQALLAIAAMLLGLSGATLLAGDGFKDLFDNLGNQNEFYSVLANVTLAY